MSSIALELFDFVDEFAHEVDEGTITADQTVAVDDTMVIFSESFFDQFFANVLKRPIEQFSAASKRDAGRLADELRNEAAATGELRALIALFEGFCDMYGELINGSYGAGDITYADFYRSYLEPLLEDAEAWAEQAQDPELLARLQAASQAQHDAVSAAKW
ncbi:MAG: hypothetical protein ACTHM1_04960 [Solirubrobacteraceae bacterium]